MDTRVSNCSRNQLQFPSAACGSFSHLYRLEHEFTIPQRPLHPHDPLLRLGQILLEFNSLNLQFVISEFQQFLPSTRGVGECYFWRLTRVRRLSRLLVSFFLSCTCYGWYILFVESNMLTHTTGWAQFWPLQHWSFIPVERCVWRCLVHLQRRVVVDFFAFFLAGGSRDKRVTRVVFHCSPLRCMGPGLGLRFSRCILKRDIETNLAICSFLHTPPWHALDCICNRLRRSLTCSELVIRTLVVFLGGW